MWSRAQRLLEETERLRREFFQLAAPEPVPCWEPPVDVLETPEGVLVVVALPGVSPPEIEVFCSGNLVSVRAHRHAPVREARILRMELPRGRFERHLELPPGAYRLLEQRLEQGCLLLTLARTRSQR